MRPETNPLKIIWKSRRSLLPKCIWLGYIVIIFFLFIADNFVPNNIIKINYNAITIEQYMILSISALAFILSMFSFGKDIYGIEDLSVFYKKNEKVYYEYLTDYLFPTFLWGVILSLSVIRLMIIVKLPNILINNLKLLYLSFVFLALISSTAIIIKNVNRFSNKVILNSLSKSK